MEQNIEQEVINAANENGSVDLNNTKAVFKLLEVKNTPKKKGKGPDPSSAEKAEKRDKDSAEQKNGSGVEKGGKKKVDEKELLEAVRQAAKQACVARAKPMTRALVHDV